MLRAQWPKDNSTPNTPTSVWKFVTASAKPLRYTRISWDTGFRLKYQSQDFCENKMLVFLGFWYSTLDNVFKDAYWFLANFRKQKLEIFCLKQEKITNLIWQKTGQMLKIIFTNSSSQNAFKLVNIFNQRKKTSPTLFGPDMHCGSNGPREKGKSPQ